MRLLPLAIAVLLPALTTPAQMAPHAGQDPANANAVALHDYESCSFDDGLQIVKVDSLPPGIQERTINTLQGPKVIRMLAGRRILFAYGMGGGSFANVKPEILPDDTWEAEKQDLLDESQAMLRSDYAMLPNTALPPEMHGLEIHGFDLTQLKGGTLGFYLLFDNARHIATSIYLLDQDPLMRRFQTIEQYRELRTRFLMTYTGCIAQNQSLHTSVTKDGR
jgi:hypothetical protein